MSNQSINRSGLPTPIDEAPADETFILQERNAPCTEPYTPSVEEVITTKMVELTLVERPQKFEMPIKLWDGSRTTLPFRNDKDPRDIAEAFAAKHGISLTPPTKITLINAIESAILKESWAPDAEVTFRLLGGQGRDGLGELAFAIRKQVAYRPIKAVRHVPHNSPALDGGYTS